MRSTIESIIVAAALSTILSMQPCAAKGDGSNENFLRRKRNGATIDVGQERKLISSNEFMLNDEENHQESDNRFSGELEDLWSQTMMVDEEEMIRFLQIPGMSMSMATRPPSPTPVPAPTDDPVPTLNPTLLPTASPSSNNTDCLEGTTREAFLADVLSEITETSLLLDQTTPQGQAFEWIANNDPLEPDVCTYPTIEQRYGLATFFYATDGFNWVDRNLWLTNIEECSWFGVTCDNETSSAVHKLQLPLNTLGGSLPNELSTLYDAIRFDFFGNAIGGTIPVGLGNVTKLELLDLEENMLSGLFFTPEVLSLTSLIGLRGSFNDFSGQIPPTIASLTALEQLWFAENFFTGAIPAEISQLASLESLFGYSNALTGSIPAGFGSLANFTQIRLYNNRLTDSIPADLFDALLLETIRFDSNLLSGEIPTTIGNLLFLEDLRLFNNTLFGPIPSEIGNLLLLENLILNNNFFAGTIADSLFSNVGSIEFIDLSNNMFLSGTIPSTLFDLPLVRNVYLANCTFTGTLPANFGSPPNLRDLFLDGNSLQGTIPEVASGQLLQLNEFLLQNNEFTGSVPASVCALRDNTTGAILEDLWSDCGADPPQLACDFPFCCNRCFL